MRIARLLALGLLAATAAQAHEEPTAATSEQAKVYEFYAKWRRPQGPYNVPHRQVSCCNRTDCFPVGDIKRENGKYVVRPEGDNSWYVVPTSVVESNQPDPLESPDGRSHVCVIAGQVVCFTEGSGT